MTIQPYNAGNEYSGTENPVVGTVSPVAVKPTTSVSKTNKKISSSVGTVILPDDADRVGNLTQKELAAHKAGLNREKIAKTIAQGMLATKKVENDEGYLEDIPDELVRLKAAELGAKYFGDMKEMGVNVAVGVNVNGVLSDDERELLEAYRATPTKRV